MTDIIYIQEDGKKRKATTNELAQMDKDHEDYQAEQSRIEAETAAKAEARESAMAKLSKLGLTEDEIAALVP